jgi:hypothetical protein
MAKLAVVQEKLAKQGRLGPVARLLPTTAAATLRKDDPPLVIDGPYAETKEQLGGILIVEARDMAEAIEIAKQGPMADFGTVEVRPELEVAWQKAQQGR